MADRVIWKTKLDERTCPICKPRNNRVYYADRTPALPAHDFCRCKLVEYKGAAVQSIPIPLKAATSNPTEIGPAYWDVMFNKAYNLPIHVTRNERLRFRQQIQDLVKSFPCKDCSTDVISWMKSNKMEGENRSDFIGYMCNLKNFVNSKLGKDIYDCNLLLTSADDTMPNHDSSTVCQHCQQTDSNPGQEQTTSKYNPEFSTPSGEQGSLVSPDLMTTTTEDSKQNRNVDGIQSVSKRSEQYELYKAFKDYKVLSTRIIDKLCQTYNIPKPNVVFDKCPDGSNRSCTVGADTIYLDPNTYSPRSILHEFTHYAANYAGNRKLDMNEVTVDKIAQTLIEKNFNGNNGAAMVHSHNHVRHDSFFPQMSDLQTRTDNLLSGWKTRFGLFNKSLQYDPTTTVVVNPQTGQPTVAQPAPTGVGSGINVPQPVIIQDPKEDPNTGLLSMFDPVYQPFADLLGLKARDINESHTPAIISNAVTTLAESNLSDLGSLIVSLFGAITMLAVGTLGKDHIVVGDRKLMAETGGNFLWNSMRYVANPKTMDTVDRDAKQLGEALSKWNTDKSVKIVTTDTRDNRKNEQVKRMMRDRFGGGMPGMPGGGPGSGDGSGGVIFSKSGPNGPTESIFTQDEQALMGAGGPMLFTSEGGRPTRILVGADGKTIMKTMKSKDARGADIKGVIGTTMAENPFNRQSPFTFVGGGGGYAEPDKRPTKRRYSGEHVLEDLEGDFISVDTEQYYRPQQEFPNLAVT